MLDRLGSGRRLEKVGKMRIILNVTTEDSELLEQIDVELQDDYNNPLGSMLNKSAILSEIESAAKVVVARKRSKS